MMTTTYPFFKIRSYFWIMMLVTLLALAACTTSQAAPTPPPEPTTPPTATGRIVLSDVSDDPVEKIEEFTPLADYLAANLAEQGIGVGEVKVAPDLETMVDWLQKGEVDIYFDSTYPTIVVGEASGAYPILRRWKGGVGEYNSVIAVRADSDLKTLDDLNGHMIGFEDESSSSGYFMPLTYLLSNGMNMELNQVPDANVDAEEVGYVFTGDDENTVEWVFTGKVDAGAIQSTDFDELAGRNSKRTAGAGGNRYDAAASGGRPPGHGPRAGSSHKNLIVRDR